MIDESDRLGCKGTSLPLATRMEPVGTERHRWAEPRGRSEWDFASQSASAFGFADLGLKRIIGLAMPENIASVRVLEKAGLYYTQKATFWNHEFWKYVIDA
jgi:hypothetical protein